MGCFSISWLVDTTFSADFHQSLHFEVTSIFDPLVTIFQNHLQRSIFFFLAYHSTLPNIGEEAVFFMMIMCPINLSSSISSSLSRFLSLRYYICFFQSNSLSFSHRQQYPHFCCFKFSILLDVRRPTADSIALQTNDAKNSRLLCC